MSQLTIIIFNEFFQIPGVKSFLISSKPIALNQRVFFYLFLSDTFLFFAFKGKLHSSHLFQKLGKNSVKMLAK